MDEQHVMTNSQQDDIASSASIDIARQALPSTPYHASNSPSTKMPTFTDELDTYFCGLVKVPHGPPKSARGRSTSRSKSRGSRRGRRGWFLDESSYMYDSSDDDNSFGGTLISGGRYGGGRTGGCPHCRCGNCCCCVCCCCPGRRGGSIRLSPPIDRGPWPPISGPSFPPTTITRPPPYTSYGSDSDLSSTFTAPTTRPPQPTAIIRPPPISSPGNWAPPISQPTPTPTSASVPTHNPNITSLHPLPSRTNHARALDRLQSMSYLLSPLMTAHSLRLSILSELPTSSRRLAHFQPPSTLAVWVDRANAAISTSWDPDELMQKAIPRELALVRYGRGQRGYEELRTALERGFDGLRMSGYQGVGVEKGVRERWRRVKRERAGSAAGRLEGCENPLVDYSLPTGGDDGGAEHEHGHPVDTHETIRRSGCKKHSRSAVSGLANVVKSATQGRSSGGPRLIRMGGRDGSGRGKKLVQNSREEYVKPGSSGCVVI